MTIAIDPAHAAITSATAGDGPPAVARRRIPSSGELVPMIGLGTSRTFDVDPAGAEMPARVAVMRAFLDAAGSLIDSSPMYRRAEAVTGALLERVARFDVFFATKVWTDEGREVGIAQMESSIDKMKASPVMDLMQVHNLVDWRTHLPTLREWKAAGRIRYLGITEMRDFEAVEKLMREEDLDFIQIPYSIGDRRVEERVLPAARDTGTAVLVMRPFERGRLFGKVRERPLPEWAAEIDCASWAQFFLKFVLGHPAVTCPIPATSKVHHLVDNMAAGSGRQPDEAMRRRMAEAMG
ncbi:MAG: aldo/keto reductase [Planctomycetes bacterium]|nr:aldo/keto reductase [Planctomycetota bacterium]